MSAATARAATITVDTVGDPGVTGTCDLRDAITNANNQNTSGSTDCAAGSGKNDTIQFSVTGTIMLGSTLPTIVSGETLTIRGPTGSPGITINGGGSVELDASACGCYPHPAISDLG